MNFLGLRRHTSPWQSVPEPEKFMPAWTQMLKANQRAMIPRGVSEVLALGIPNESRIAVWTRLLGIGTFRPRDVNPSKKILDLIKCDIPRTFCGQCDPEQLHEVLVALTAAESPIGTYCQGLNYLAAIFLQAAGDDDRALDFSVLGLEALILKLDMKSYFFEGMRQLRADMLVLTNLIESTLPHVLPLFRKSGIELSYCVANWFLCLFSNIGLELLEVLRLWDYIFAEGFEAVVRISIALLEHSLPNRSIAFIEHDDLAQRVKSFSTDALTILQLATAYALPSKTDLCKERRDALQSTPWCHRKRWALLHRRLLRNAWSFRYGAVASVCGSAIDQLYSLELSSERGDLRGKMRGSFKPRKKTAHCVKRQILSVGAQPASGPYAGVRSSGRPAGGRLHSSISPDDVAAFHATIVFTSYIP